jgi:hypothetical protein
MIKQIIAILLFAFSTSAFTQDYKDLISETIDLGNIRSATKFVLKVTPQTPDKVKIHFNYQYRFTSEEIAQVYVGGNGNLGFSTRTTYSDLYDSKQKVTLDISDSTVFSKNDELQVILNVSKPSKNSHWIKVEVSLQDAKGNTVSGGRKLLGILGRSYKIEAIQCE